MLPVESPRGAVAPLHSLYSVANVYTPSDSHWEGGVSFFPDVCGDAGIWVPCVSGDCGPTFVFRFDNNRYGIWYDAQTAAFNVGATLTGATSGATATIDEVTFDFGAVGFLTLSSVTGSFQDNEIISDNGGTPGSATSNGTDGRRFGAGAATHQGDSFTIHSVVWDDETQLTGIAYASGIDADLVDGNNVLGPTGSGGIVSVDGNQTVADMTLENEHECCVDCDVVHVDPYMVYRNVSCTSFSTTEEQYYRSRALRALDASAPHAVEREFFLGEKIPSNPHLAAGSDVTVLNSGNATSPSLAMNYLNQYLGSTCPGGSPGVVHATPLIVPSWERSGDVHHMARTTDNGSVDVLKNVDGHGVVSGGGYPGTGPDGEAVTAAQAWVYATRNVEILESGPRVEANTIRDTLDRKINRTVMTAEKTVAVLTDDCCLAAILVDISI